MSTKRQKAEYTIQVADDSKDRISELPDEILHIILRRIDRPIEAAKTIALSSRWRSLWNSYPVLKFQPTKAADGFVKFVDSSIERFSRNKQLEIETLEVSLGSGGFRSFDHLERVLKLACERKAQEIGIRVWRWNNICIPYRLLSDSCAKILTLEEGILLVPDSDSCAKIHNRLRLKKLQTLELGAILPSRFLETLQLGETGYARKLRIFNLPNLKTFKFGTCHYTQEIEIEAAQLESLNLDCPNLLKLELTAPQLKHLDLKLPKVKLWSPKLETFHVHAHYKLEEIELDAGPSLSRFVLNSFSPGVLKGLKRCEIFNTASCAWAVHFTESPSVLGKTVRSFMGSVKGFIARFPRFQTVNITINKRTNMRPNDEDETDHTPCSMAAINHLELCTDFSLGDDQEALLRALFCECRPKFFTLIHNARNSTRFFQKLLKNMSSSFISSRGRIDTPPPLWRECGLKDVKIVNGDVDRTTAGVEEEGLIDVSKDTANLLAEKKRVSFMLTWSK